MNALHKIILFIFLTGLVPSTSVLAAECNHRIRVSDVYPTADILPENLLRFYIYFDTAMSRDNALSSIYLLDPKGQQINGAFLTNKVDLWSPDAKRLTVLFDPGRVKTGLVAHNQMGRALKRGEEYTLVIDKSIQSLMGCNLTRTHFKKFSVTDEDFESPNLDKWRVVAPKQGTRNWLSVALNGSHDHVSLAYRIRVINKAGHIVKGRIALGEHERQWRFKPQTDWEKSEYRILVNPNLEDIAGNRLTGSFEEPITGQIVPEFFLSFRPK